MRTWTQKSTWKKLGGLFAVAAILVSWGVSSPVAADLIVIEVNATSGGESDSYVWLIPKAFDASDHMDWEMPGPVTLVGANGPLAIINSLSLGLDGDPGVSLSFSVTSADSNAIITIPFAMNTLGFAAIENPMAYASAAITLTDIDSNGALLTGMYPGGKTYQAAYNTAPLVVWDNILDGLSAGSDMSTAGFARRPAAGREQIFDSLTSIQTQFKFKLSVNDTASGTSRFDVQPPIPEPGTVALVGTGLLIGLGWMRRRRIR